MDTSLIELLADFDWYVWVGLPLLIFLARVFDVTLGTLRIIFTSRGLRNLAPVLGFIETFVWIVAVSSLVKHAQNLAAYVGYAAVLPRAPLLACSWRTGLRWARSQFGRSFAVTRKS